MPASSVIIAEVLAYKFRPSKLMPASAYVHSVHIICKCPVGHHCKLTDEIHIRKVGTNANQFRTEASSVSCTVIGTGVSVDDMHMRIIQETNCL